MVEQLNMVEQLGWIAELELHFSKEKEILFFQKGSMLDL